MSLYTWGLGKNGQLATGVAETTHTPQMIKKQSDGSRINGIKFVECGALFTAILTEHGSVFTSGCGKYGRLGQTNNEEDSHLFQQIMLHSLGDAKTKCVQVSCGSWHAAAITDNGALFTWGYSKASAQVLEPKNFGYPSLIGLPFLAKVKGVSCGHNYTFAWTEEGQLYSWGSGTCGVLGQGSEENKRHPQLVKALKDHKVEAVGAGHSHCGLVTAEGQLYMTGKGVDGALGLGRSQLTNALTPTLCDTGSEVIDVSCSKGEHHGFTLALTRDGTVLAWGDGYKGKLGQGDHEPRFSPTVIPGEHFNNEAVVSISAGGIHSAAATGSGEVYTWGCGSDGRLGHPEGQGHRYLFRSDVPKRVECLPKIGTASGTGSRGAIVSCSYYHTAAIVG